MQIKPHLPETNRRLLSRVNRLVFRRSRELLTRRLIGERFRTAFHAEEGMEVAGLEAYDVDQPSAHIDFTRVTVPWEYMAVAMSNQELLVKQFEKSAEHEFVLVLDLSRSMRFPLRRIYAGETWEQLPLETMLSAKPTLLKLVAGAFMHAALESGFRVRVVEFGQHGIEESPPLRRGQDATMALFNKIDAHFGSIARREESLYQSVVSRLFDRKGVFVFVGDFMDAAYDWEQPAKRRSWLKMLGHFEQWALRRPVVTVRVNHSDEVKRPLRTTAPFGQEPNLWGDRCDVQVETLDVAEEADYANKFESSEHLQARLLNQQAWSRNLDSTLRSCCRGYLTVDDRASERELVRQLHRTWSNLVGR